MKETLEELILRVISDLDDARLNPRVDEFRDYKAPHVVLRPSVKVEIAVTEGKVIKIDVTDYFEKAIR